MLGWCGRLKRNKLALFTMFDNSNNFICNIWTYAFEDKGLYLWCNKSKAVDLRPSAEHWFGTDDLGRDLFVRVMYGARYSLILAIAPSLINVVIGVYMAVLQVSRW